MAPKPPLSPKQRQSLLVLPCIQYIGGDRKIHRKTWKKLFGAIPEGLGVLHECDNFGCIEPTHLWLGTHQENMRDKQLKGRAHSLAGELQPRSKLKNAQIYEIRESKDKNVVLARRYGVGTSVISSVRSRKTWKHIPEREQVYVPPPLMSPAERRKLIELPFPVVRSLPHSRAHGGCMTVDDKVSNRTNGTHGTRRMDPTEGE